MSVGRFFYCLSKSEGRAGYSAYFCPKFENLDQAAIVKLFREKGMVTIEDGNKKLITLLKPEVWAEKSGTDWTYLLFDIFQIRTLCEQFSEVSLDIVEFASKPTIYHSPANKVGKKVVDEKGNVQFSIIREPNWNKLLFQISQPVLAKVNAGEKADFSTTIFYPLLMAGAKEMFLGSEGDVKIIKG